MAHGVIGAAIDVHRHLGPGLLESTYEVCLCHEIEERGIPFERQCQLPVSYKGKTLDAAYRLDLLVDRCLIVEIKAVEELLPVHRAQLLSYLRVSGLRLGLLLNFYVERLGDGGIRRVANGLQEK